jgi:hypothetical protein
MAMNKAPYYIALTALAVLLPVAALAHQPRLVTGPTVTVLEPEVSKAYYGVLEGQPAVFSFQAPAEFDLYVGLLVPDIAGARTDLSATINRDGQVLVALDGGASTWKKFHEEFAGDDYLQGPEFRARGQAGSYEIAVSAPGDRGKYVLAVGEKESFTPAETLNALRVIPELKTGFFGQPTAAGFVTSVFGAVSLALALAAGALLALISRRLIRLFKKKSAVPIRRNLGRPDRLYRLVIAVISLAAGLILWSPILQLVAGYVLFEAVAGWCVVYAAMGRNTCPIG